MFLSKFPPLSRVNNAIRFIAFISDEYLGNVDLSVLFNLSQPCLDIVESLHIRAVIDQYDSHCPFVIGLSDRPKAFLPCCIPDLELYSFVVDVNFLDLEIYAYKNFNNFKSITNGGHVAYGEGVLGKA